ncbi:MAG: ComF family protein [Phycisphaerales bacterium JB039]
MGAPAAAGKAFRWPPGPAGSDRSPDVGGAVPAPPPARLASVALAFESMWLGLAAAPIAQLRAEGWAPDGPLAYCPRCAQNVGPFEADGDGCPACRGRRPPWRRLVRLGSYDDALRDAIMALKFQAWRRVGTDLGALLGRAIAERLDAVGVDRREVALAPAPMVAGRRIVRGIDHTLVLARAASGASGAPLQRLLYRRRRPAQTSLTATERARAQAGAFGGMSGVRPAALVVVIDDVLTTGATMRSACAEVGHLQRASGQRAQVWGAVVAVTAARGQST